MYGMPEIVQNSFNQYSVNFQLKNMCNIWKNAEFYAEFGNVIHIFLSAHLAEKKPKMLSLIEVCS